jgi:tetratricopeptide (TPR) repeat protein
MFQDTNANAQDLKEQGNASVKSGNFAEAVFHYTHAIKLDPKNFSLYSNRSLAFLKMQQYYYALDDAQQTIDLRPDWAKVIYLLIYNWSAGFVIINQ